MNSKSLEILKELAATEDCSIHWNSDYNMALNDILNELKKHRLCGIDEQETCDVEKRRLQRVLLRCR